MDVMSTGGHFFQVSELPELVSQLFRGALTWSNVQTRFPEFTAQETTI